MKKFVVTGLLAIAVVAISQQEASAWINTKFGIGLNWQMQSGGNNFLWGAYRNGQVPGPEAYGYPQHAPYMHHSHGMAPMPMPMQQGTMNAQSVEPAQQYLPTYQFANYPRPVYYYYYYPSYPSYYYYGQ